MPRNLRRITAPLRRAGQRRFLIDAVRSTAPAPVARPSLARPVGELLWGGLLLLTAFFCFSAWLANVWRAAACAVAFTGLTRVALERAGTADRTRRGGRARLRAALRETAQRLASASAAELTAYLTRCLGRFDFAPPVAQSGFGGAEGMIVSDDGQQRVAIYFIADGAAVLDASAVIIAAAELARVEGARHFFAATGEFTAVAYQRAERVGIALIDRYELAAICAADMTADPVWTPAAGSAPSPGRKRPAAALTLPTNGLRWRQETRSLAESLAFNRTRIAGHGRVLALLLPLSLLTPGSLRPYLLGLLLANAALLVYRQWLNFRLLAGTATAHAWREAPFAAPDR